MVFNATFNNISVILQQSVLLVEETGVSRENLYCKIQDEDTPTRQLWGTRRRHSPMSITRHIPLSIIIKVPDGQTPH